MIGLDISAYAIENAHPDAKPGKPDLLPGDGVARLGDDGEIGREAVTIETYFEDRDPDPVFARQSGSVLMVYFSAAHDMVYGAAASWFATDPGNEVPRQSSLPWENES